MEQQQQQINQFIVQLEKYCNDLQSPNGALRDAAEKFIIKFTTMASPYAVCFSLFEQSQSSLVHFYGLTALRDAIIREWATLDAGAKWSITERLMKYMLSYAHTTLSNATKNQSYNTMAVLIKRSWLDEERYADSKPLGQIIVDHMRSQMFANDRLQQEVAIGTILSIVTEFSMTSKASQTQQTWDYHQQAMLSFQKSQLLSIFNGTVQLLCSYKSDIVSRNNINDRFIYMLFNAIQLLENICDWRFLRDQFKTLTLLAKYKTNRYNFRPPIEWAPSLIENTVVFDLVFELYPLVKTHKDISHVLRNIMICLCCLNGEIMEGSETTKLYMCNIIDRVAPLLASAIQQQQQQQQQLTNTNWSEIEDLSQLVRFFCSNFQFQSFLLIPIEKSRTFFENLTKYIIASMEYLKLTVNSDDIDLEDELENEFFFVLIKAWVGLLADIENVQNKSKKSKHILNNEYFTYLVGIIKVCSEQIYSNYIKTRIELSILELTNDKNQSSNDDNEIDQDKNKYNDQLKVISYLGRINPGISMDLLTKEINKTVDQLINSGDARAFETLHWLILLAGNLLFDSEVVLNGIPNKLETYTYDQSQAGAAKDLVVELSNAVFRYCLDFELKAMLHYKSVEQFSPLIAETCTWFLDGWSLVYLYPTLDLNINISPKLMEAFGPPKVYELVNLLLLKVNLNLKYWNGELPVLEQTVLLLKSLCINKQILPQLIGSPHWKEMLSLPAEFLRLNPKIQAKIFSSFTRVVYSAEDPSEKQHRFIQLTQSITNPLDTVFQRADFKNIAQNPEVRETLFTLLHRLNGIVSIPEEVNTYEDEVPLHLAFDLFHKYANAFVSLIPLYIHYPDTVNLILTLFSQFTKFQLETVDEERSKKIFPILVELFNTISNVSQTNTSKVNLENKEQYNRIKMQLRIINNIILFNDVQNNYPKLIVQAVLHGICVTIPCITNNGLLEYTKLSNTFFSIIHFLFSSDTIDLSAFPPNIFNTLLSLIEYGIAHHDTEIANHSLNSILALAKNIQGMLESSIQVDISFTTQLVGSMINFLLLHDFNMDELLYNASNAFIELVILNTDGFKSKVNQLIQHQEAWLHPRLTNSFTQLLNSIEQYKKDKNNENREGYLNNIKKFISTVKPLLKKN